MVAETNDVKRQRGHIDAESEPIAEGEGRFPWWIWVAILIWIIYAFFIAPFEITAPGGG